MMAMPKNENYPNLFSEFNIGSVAIKNRITMAATAEVFSIPDGLISKRNVFFLREIARGGAGLIVTGNRLTDWHSSAPCRGYSWGFIGENVERDRVLTKAVHQFGTRIFMQLNHFGSQANTMSNEDPRNLISSCAMKSPTWGETPRPMIRADMDRVIEMWVASAKNAERSGFDGTEVHMANGYLMHQFLSRTYNKRDDEYGGSLENRLRFPLELMRRLREELRDGFGIGVRLCADEMIPDGMKAEECAEIANRFTSEGLVDYVSLAGGSYHAYSYEVPPSDIEDCWLVARSEVVKSAVDVPVIISGAITRPDQAEDIISNGAADAIAMTRAFMADPEFARKSETGVPASITHCIRCNQGCINRLYRASPIACTVNPASGREELLGRDTIMIADRPKNWVVVGGGPAGMHAAVTLASRGHSVSLIERSPNLGGQAQLIARQPGRESFAALVKDLKHKLEQCGVKIQCLTMATPQSIMAMQPDGVIIATGAEPIRNGFSAAMPFTSALPGAGQDNVHTSWDVMEGASIGHNVLFVDDEGSRNSAGVVQFLQNNGHNVHVLTKFPMFGPGTGQTLEMSSVYQSVFSNGLVVTPNSWITSINGDKATITHLYTGSESVVDGFDSFVLACGSQSIDDLYHALKGQVQDLYLIGDALAPRNLDSAIFEAELAGREMFNDPSRYIETGALDKWDDGFENMLASDGPTSPAGLN